MWVDLIMVSVEGLNRKNRKRMKSHEEGWILLAEGLQT